MPGWRVGGKCLWVVVRCREKWMEIFPGQEVWREVGNEEEDGSGVC